MKGFLVVIATCAVLVATSSMAKADLVLTGPTPATSFVDLGAQGFGNAPRMLTLQDKTFEFGSVTPVDVVHDGAISGANKSTTPTLGTLGWNSGANVGIGFNSDQSGQTGITLQTLVLTIYNGTSVVATFSLLNPVNFSPADVALQKGNGNAIFNFALDSTEQGEFKTLVASQAGFGDFRAGLSSSLGCSTPTAGCMESNGGPDSFIGFNQSAVPAPDGGMTLMLLGGALFGLGALRRKFRV